MRWLLFLALTAACLASPSLSLQGNTDQGWPLFLAVQGVEPGVIGLVRWADEEFSLTPADEEGKMRTVLPVLHGMSPGRHQLLVELSSGERLSRTVPVRKRDYGHQSISLNPTTLASYDEPQNKADDEKILEALQPFTGQKRWNGQFVLPVQAPQTTGYGLRRTYNGWKKGWHKGLDLAGWEGEPVKAPAAGVVIHTARGIVNGNTVVLDHGLGVGSNYLHLDQILVKEGDRLDQGQVLGTVGGTGGFAPHLHWEVRVHGHPVHLKAFQKIPRDWR